MNTEAAPEGGRQELRFADYLRLFAVFARISFQDDAAYRGEFWVRILSTVYSLAMVAAGLWVVFSNTDEIAGWNLAQVIVLVGTYHVVAGVVRAVFAPNLQRIVDDVREGTLDFLLTKPGSSQFIASFRRIVVPAAPESFLGLGVVAYGVWQLADPVGLYAAAAFAASLACGLVILYSFWLFIITFVFWFVRIENVTQIFWSLFEAGRYPLDIYPGWLRFLVSYVVPVAIITTIPARSLAIGLNLDGLAAFVVFAVVALAAASWFWSFGIRHYTSASS